MIGFHSFGTDSAIKFHDSRLVFLWESGTKDWYSVLTYCIIALGNITQPVFGLL